MRKLAVALCTLSIVAAAQAAIFADGSLGLGPNPLPATLSIGGYTLSPLPADTRPEFSSVSSIPGSPVLTGDVGFSPNHEKRQVGSSWGTWASGRFPVMYWTAGSTSSTYTFPANTGAVAFWVEPNPFQAINIVATAQDGTTLSLTPHGQSGALGYAFYATGGDSIASISLSGGADYAVGEFYGAQVPEPATLSLLGLAGLALIRRR